MKSKHRLLVVGILFFAWACGPGSHVENKSPVEEEHAHHDEREVFLTDEQMMAVSVKLGRIEEKELSGTLKANGMLRVPNNHQANVTSLFGGIIQSLTVELGDYVRKGQVIATVSNPQFIQLQEEYLSLESKMAFAEQELRRQQDLREGNVGALKNLQTATAELQALQTRKASLHEQIRMMGISPQSLSNSNLRTSLAVTSPISGTVSDVFAKIGSYVDVSAPIAAVVENNALHLDLQVFEKDVPSVRVGQAVDFVVTNNPAKTYAGRVFNIGASFNGNSKTITVHCDVLGDKSGLIDGMNITGAIYLGKGRTPAVPDEAIVNAEGKYYIFRVKARRQGSTAQPEAQGEHAAGVLFEKVEVIKGVSELGYTAITPLTTLPNETEIIVRNAFFANAKLTNAGDEHAH